MKTDSSKIFENIDEAQLLKKLLSGRMDGALLLDLEADRIIPVNNYFTGKFKKFINNDNLSYSSNVNMLITEYASYVGKEEMKKSVSPEGIKKGLEQESVYSVDIRIKPSREGEVFYKRLRYTYYDDKSKLIILSCEDSSSVISNDIDPLTGIYNTMGFHKRVTEWLEENPGRKYRLQRYDIDRFRDINGLHGYGTGNKLLRDFGQKMKKLDAKDSISAHIGADHFVRFCADDYKSAEEFCDDFRRAFENYGLKMPITIHMGIYDLCESGCDVFTMSYKAQLALQKSKGKFNESVAYYKKGMMSAETEQQELLKDVDKAFEKDEFEVWFQPQINYRTKETVGAEALTRWRHGKKGLLVPKQYVPLLERSGRIAEVDRFSLKKVSRYMRKWMDMMPEKKIVISGNLSRAYLRNTEFIKHIENALAENGIPVRNFRCEVTESAYTEQPEKLIEVMKELRSHGFIVEMDDFGSAYSSLNNLKDIEVDVLKLDMKFLANCPNSKRSEIIISSVISLAKALGIPVIAEGVETKQQADMLFGFGCEIMQGYYFSKPVPAEEYEKMLMAE